MANCSSLTEATTQGSLGTTKPKDTEDCIIPTETIIQVSGKTTKLTVRALTMPSLAANTLVAGSKTNVTVKPRKHGLMGLSSKDTTNTTKSQAKASISTSMGTPTPV